MVDADGSTPLATLRRTPAPDDAGAETADRYEWQAMMAACDALALYFEALEESGQISSGSSFTVFCEHHEDWSVACGETTEIVSAKHRESTRPPLSTYRQLLDEGGVLHLFERWQALGRTPTCRLVTTGGLRDAGADTELAGNRLRTDLDCDDETVDAVVAGIGSTITSLRTVNGMAPASEPDEVIRAFLAGLRFQHGQPRRDHLPDMAGERYGKPIAVRLGRPDGGAAVWQAVLALVRPRMRAAGPSEGGALPVVTGVEHDDALAPRTLTLEDVDTAVRFALDNVAGYAPLPRVVKANRMAVKMARGGCSDNAVERADELRLQYRRYWRARRSNPNTSDLRRRVDNILLRVVDEATDGVRTDDKPWGARLWRELGHRLEQIEGRAEAYGLDADLLLGGVSELANNCQAWYSDRFDTQKVLRTITTTATQ